MKNRDDDRDVPTRRHGAQASKRSPQATIQVEDCLSPLGPLVVAATTEALCRVEFGEVRDPEARFADLSKRLGCSILPGGNDLTRQTVLEINAYFAGRLTEFSVPILVSGTDFQRRVWAELRRIPYGQTASYGEVARRIGKPTAVRAVARANGDNRLAIIIPCHRVIGSDGSLTGYGGGLWRKQHLLDLEQGIGRLW